MAKAELSGVGSEAILDVNLCKQFSPSTWPDGESKPRRCSVYPGLLAAYPLGKQPAIVSSEAACFCLGVKRGPRRGSLTAKEPGRTGSLLDEGREHFLSISETRTNLLR